MRAWEFLTEMVHELHDDILQGTMNEFRSSNENDTQHWKPVNFSAVQRIWVEASKMGFVRNEKGLNQIAEQIITKIVQLQVNTELAGHTSIDPNDMLQSDGIEPFTDEEYERFVDWLVDEKTGQWRISDYALDKLYNLANKLMNTASSDEKLVIVDTILSVTHQRSELAELFIEGGQQSLNILSDIADEVEKN